MFRFALQMHSLTKVVQSVWQLLMRNDVNRLPLCLLVLCLVKVVLSVG